MKNIHPKVKAAALVGALAAGALAIVDQLAGSHVISPSLAALVDAALAAIAGYFAPAA